MPLVTDPRQIVSPLPASLIKEVLDGLPSDSSTEERSTQTEREPQLARGSAPTRNVETEAGKQPDSIPGASAPTEGRIFRDPIWEGKFLVEAHACWSLSTSQEYHGELPVLSHEAKEQINQEEIRWRERDAREQESEKWKAFQP